MKEKKLQIFKVILLLFFVPLLFVSLFQDTHAAVTDPGCNDLLSGIYWSANCISQRGGNVVATPSSSATATIGVPLATSTGSSSAGAISGSGVTSPCNNPFDPSYTSQSCAQQRLGVAQIQGNEIFIARDPYSLIVVAFRILLGALAVLTVGGILWDGLKYRNAGDDAEKKKEFWQSLIWRIAVLVIGLGGVGITYIVQVMVFGEKFNDRVIDCTTLNSMPSPDPDLVVKCQAVLQP